MKTCCNICGTAVEILDDAGLCVNCYDSIVEVVRSSSTTKERHRRNYLANRPYRLTYRREYAKNHHPQELAYQRRYQQGHRSEINAKQRERYARRVQEPTRPVASPAKYQEDDHHG